jgi:outer membrane protein TolC
MTAAFFAFGPAHAKTQYTLAELIDLAKHNPGLLAAARATEVVEAQMLEAKRSWLPTGEIYSLIAPSPDIRCDPDENIFPRPAGKSDIEWRQEHCYRTNISETTLRFGGVFSRTEVKLVQPLFTFGKISSGVAAGRSGILASKSREAGIAEDLALNVKKAYWGAKLARDVLATLNEGIDYLDEAQATIEKDLKEGTGNVTVADRLRLRTVRTEVDARLLEARRGTELARAGLRALIGPDAPATIDVDPEPLAAVNVPKRPLSHYEELARLSRPEVRALDHLVAAKRSLAEVEWRKQYPDVVLVGSATLAYATSVDNPRNAFYSDPFNSTSAGLAAALRLPLDLGVKNARAARLRAEAEEAGERRREALGGIAFEVHRAYLELNEAQERAVVLERGEKAGKQWVASVAQNLAAGLAEPKDFADALVAFFQFRARRLQALHDINLAAAALARATGGDVIAP